MSDDKKFRCCFCKRKLPEPNETCVTEVCVCRSDAPAPTGDAYEDVDGWAKPGCTVAPATAAVSNLNLQVGETLTREKLDSVFRYLSDFVTAARAEERERVWRKIYEVAKNAPVMRTDNGQQLGKEFVLDEIREAALADGVDLTSLAKPE